MTASEYQAAFVPLVERAELDGDALCLVYFSHSEDRYGGSTYGMDAGDALFVVKQLIEEFGLCGEVIAAMGERVGL